MKRRRKGTERLINIKRSEVRGGEYRGGRRGWKIQEGRGRKNEEEKKGGE